MLYTSGDLAILGAESYNPGNTHPSSTRVSKRPKKSTTATVTDTSHDDAPRKRRKASQSDDAGEDGEKKRSRGRPRLEPNDETAQDVSSVYLSYSRKTRTFVIPPPSRLIMSCI